MLGLALRLVYLDADPDYYAWIGYVTDEGRWLKHARDLALFGHAIGEEQALHVHLAPLFHLAHLLVFKLSGVSFVTARLLTAVAGCALLVIAWIFLRRVATPQALVVALLLLAFEVDLIAMSRIAIPEMPAMLFQLAAFAVILTPPASAARMMTAGFLLLLAVAAKATVLPVVPIFVALVVILSRQGARQRLRHVLMFGAGFCGPVVLIALVWLARRGPVRIQSLRDTVDVVRSFLAPSSLYSVVSVPFDSTLAPLLNVWGILACLAFIGWIASSRNATGSMAHDCYIASLFWFGAYSAVMLSLDYFPERYRIHLLVPLALNIAAGLTLFQRAGLGEVTRAFQRMSPKTRIAASTILALPTAAFWAPLLASGYHLIGGDAGHLRIRVAAVAVALVPTVMVLAMQLRRGRPPLAFIVFPVTATLAWLISDRVGLDGLPFWPAPEHDPWTWTLAVGWLAIPAAWVLARLLTGRMASWRLRAIPIAAAAYVFLSLVRILPAYIVPQYTMKQASESLGRELSGFKGVIATSAAETLFNANTLQYRNTPDFGERQPDALLVAFDVPNVEREYRLVARWEIFISPRYVWPPERAPEAGRSRLPVKLYVRRLARTAWAADSW